jgi:hypothetical protein
MDCKDRKMDSIVMAGDHVDKEAATEEDEEEEKEEDLAAEDLAK